MKKIVAEFKDLSKEALTKKLHDTRQELAEKSAKVRLGQGKKSDEIPKLRKTIAILLTLLNAN